MVGRGRASARESRTGGGSGSTTHCRTVGCRARRAWAGVVRHPIAHSERTFMSDEDTRKVAELVKGQKFGFLTTTTPEGKLTSRPVALQEVEFDGDLWFFAEQSAPWLTHI